MPRQKKDQRFDASDATIREFFNEMRAAAAEQKAASGIIADLNTRMADAGVHPGVLSAVRRIEAMPEGKRGFFTFLLRRYLDIREQELRDPTFTAPTEAAEAKPEAAFPFERKATAA
jgi:hypothetical protein